MKFVKFMKKVLKNEDEIFDPENIKLREIWYYAVVSVALIFMLATSGGRWFLKWLVYLGAGGMATMMVAMAICNVFEILKTFRYCKKLEKLGSSYEEEERARRYLCKVEGDDGLPPQN